MCHIPPHPMGAGRAVCAHTHHGSRGCMRRVPTLGERLSAQSYHRCTHPGRHTGLYTVVHTLGGIPAYTPLLHTLGGIPGIYTTITHPGRHTRSIYHLYTPWEAYPGYILPVIHPGRHTRAIPTLLHTLGGIPGLYPTVTHPGRHTRVYHCIYSPREAYTRV